MRNFELKDSSGVTFAYVSKDHDQPWIYVKWVGTLKIEELKRVMMKHIDVIKHNECPYVLSDCRESRGNLFEINHFIENKWASIAVEAGLQGIANVTRAVASSQFTARDLASRMLGFEFKSFDSLEEAEAWLWERATQAAH